MVCVVGAEAEQGEDEPRPRFFRSRKGRFQLFFAGYVYNREDHYYTKMIWKCSDYRRSKCKGRCQTQDFQVVRVSGQHNHGPNFELQDVEWLEPASYETLLE